jgi:hypothetical protein
VIIVLFLCSTEYRRNFVNLTIKAFSCGGCFIQRTGIIRTFLKYTFVLYFVENFIQSTSYYNFFYIPLACQTLSDADSYSFIILRFTYHMAFDPAFFMFMCFRNHANQRSIMHTWTKDFQTNLEIKNFNYSSNVAYLIRNVICRTKKLESFARIVLEYVLKQVSIHLNFLKIFCCVLWCNQTNFDTYFNHSPQSCPFPIMCFYNPTNQRGFEWMELFSQMKCKKLVEKIIRISVQRIKIRVSEIFSPKSYEICLNQRSPCYWRC